MAKKPKEEKIPKSLAEVFKDKELTEKFEAFCKKEHTLDNFTFVTLKSWNAQNVYKIYFAKNAKYELNLPDKLIAESRDLGEKKAWDDRRWKGIMTESQNQIESLMARDTFKRFLTALEKEYKAAS